MDKKEKTESKIVLERTYNIPLRREWIKSPKYRRAKKAMTGIRKFLSRHIKAEEEDIKLGGYLNLEVWKHGIKNPPHHVKVNVTKDDKGVVKAELFNAPKEILKEDKKEKKAVEKEEGKEKKAEEPKHEEVSPEARKVESEELKLLKKERPKQHAPKVAPEPVEVPRAHKIVGTQKGQQGR